jgi:ABC-type sugar transport system permease subunit/ABC-type glycerol-3-phosphate transport system substrate-binding protein
MRWLLSLVTILTVTSLGAAQGPRPLILWGLDIDANQKGREAIIREFQRRHPEYLVRNLSLGSGRMDPQKLMTSIVGNVAPDVINQDRFTISDWASRGAFLALDDFIARDARRDPLAPVAADYYASAWQEACYGGHVYGIPAAADNRALYWNRGIFRQRAAELRAAGLDPARPPRTWSELLAYSKALSVKNSDGSWKSVGFLPDVGNTWLYIYAFANNAQFMSPDGRTCTATSPEVEESLRFIVQGYDQLGGYDACKAFESGFLFNENDPFMIGKVAMKIDGNWILNDLSRYAPHLDFAVAPPPVPDDRYAHRGRFSTEKDTFTSWSGGFCYSIPRGARNVAGGWEFIKFASSVEGRLVEAEAQKAWENHRGRTFIPYQQANRVANEEIFRRYKPRDLKFANAVKTHIDLMSVAKMRPVTFVGQMLWNENQRAVDNACLHKLTPHEALLRDQETVQAEIDNYYNHEKHPPINLSMLAAAFLIVVMAFVTAGVISFRRQRLGRLAKHEARWGLLFVVPWLVGFAVFTLGPMLASFFLSFTEYNALTDARWVGLKNYTDLATTDHVNVYKAFSNAFYLAGVGVPLGICTGLAVALLLNTNVRGMRWYRTIFYLPAIVPTIPSAILWSWVLSSDTHQGLVNGIWQNTISQWLSIPPPGWLQAEAWSKPALILMGLWGAGSGMILWLAGLKGVPRSLYEAAEIDGASPRQQFVQVTLPQLSPIIFFNIVVGFIGALQEFDRIYVMKPADETIGPGDSLLMPVYHLFTSAFDYFKMGYASALAWVVFLIILCLTALQFKLAPRWVHYEADK